MSLKSCSGKSLLSPLEFSRINEVPDLESADCLWLATDTHGTCKTHTQTWITAWCGIILYSIRLAIRWSIWVEECLWNYLTTSISSTGLLKSKRLPLRYLHMVVSLCNLLLFSSVSQLWAEVSCDMWRSKSYMPVLVEVGIKGRVNWPHSAPLLVN